MIMIDVSDFRFLSVVLHMRRQQSMMYIVRQQNSQKTSFSSMNIKNIVSLL